MRRIAWVLIALMALMASMAASSGDGATRPANGDVTDIDGLETAGLAASPDSWEWQNPLPQGNTLHSVWGSSHSDVFAVGDGGTILHYNGNSWSPMNSGTVHDLWGIWGASASDVFVVGWGGTILHYNGRTWGSLTVPSAAWLTRVWGASSSDVFAVGLSGTILHYNGSSWSRMNSGTTGHLWGIWGASASDVFAVGEGGTVIHYNGSSWTPMTSGTTVWLTRVWGKSSSDVFAAGHDGTILHYNGNSWSAMNTGTAWNTLWGIWGASASDVFAVGTNGEVLHFNGSTWSPMASGTPKNLDSVWGASSSDVFAVGWDGNILHYDGSRWSFMTSSIFDSELTGVWGSSSSNVFVVGRDGTILRYNGSAWNFMASGTTVWLTAVWGVSSSDVFAVGLSGTILHYNGSSWSRMNSGTTDGLSGIWGASASDVFAVGGAGTILHFDGNSWSTMTSGTTNQLDGVWGASSSDVFAVGDAGTILHFDGNSWSTMITDTTEWLYGVWGTSKSDVFAVGSPLGPSTILHYDGSVWSIENGPGPLLDSVWGSSASDIFAVGNGGIAHYDGLSWTYVPGIPKSLRDVWGSSSSDVFVVGDGGTILHYGGESSPSIATGAASDVTQTSATLNGNLTSLGSGSSVQVSFEWGLTTAYGTTTTPKTMSAAEAFSAALSGLTPGATYHFRAKAVAGNITVSGADQTLTALPATDTTPPAAVTDLAAHTATTTSVTLTWTVPGDDGNTGQASTYDIKYSTATITDANWGSASQCSGEPAPKASGSAETFTVTGLSPNTLYYFAIKTADEVTNWSGLSNVVNTKTEAAAVAPTVSTLAAGGIGSTSATLNLSLTSLGAASAAQVSFEWGPGTAYGNTTTPQTMTGTGAFSATISGLTPGTAYHFRAKVVGGGLAALGADEAFTTLAGSHGTITGKGIWIWKLSETEGGDISKIAARLVGAGVTWVAIKAGDSDSFWTGDNEVTAAVVSQLHGSGIKVLGWQYVYGQDLWGVADISEADVANRILDIPGIDGLIIDAEEEYERLEGRAEAATAYMQAIRAEHPTSFVAYSPFPIVDYHQSYPYLELGEYADAVMPQAYWREIGVGPEEMLTWMKQQWEKWNAAWQQSGHGDSVKPLIPAGQGWNVSGDEIAVFCSRAFEGGYQAVILWRYDLMTDEMWRAYGGVGVPTSRSPQVGDIAPGTGKRDQRLTVTISGANFDGATEVGFGPGITVQVFDVSSTEIAVEITIDANADLGKRDVSVTTSWGTATITDGFEVVDGGGGGICSAGAPGAPSGMIPVFVLLGLGFGGWYWLVRRGCRTRSAGVQA